jgi:hypothetical protein
VIRGAPKKGIRMISTTIPLFEGATRDAVNEWIRRSGKFDAVVDFDQRSATRPARRSWCPRAPQQIACT